MGFQPYDEKVLNTSIQQFTVDSGASRIVFGMAGPYGTRYDHFIVSSTALIPHDIMLDIHNGSAGPLCTVSIPAGAGTTVGVPAIDLLSYLPAGMDGVRVPAYYGLGLTLLVALTGAETITIVADGGDF